jgi:hypothetical protein
MTEAFDALETELGALQPREVSPQLPQRIAERLEGAAWSWKRRLSGSVVLAGGVAAGLALALFLWRGSRPSPLPEIVVKPSPAPVPSPVARDDRLPTVRAYQQAWAESPEAFEALLDKHAQACSLSVGTVDRATLIAPYPFLSTTIGDH